MSPGQRHLYIWEKLVDPPVLGDLLALGKYLLDAPVQEYTDISVCKCAVIMHQHLYITNKKKHLWNEQAEHLPTL